jgi:hypothetical protein
MAVWPLVPQSRGTGTWQYRYHNLSLEEMSHNSMLIKDVVEKIAPIQFRSIIGLNFKF